MSGLAPVNPLKDHLRLDDPAHGTRARKARASQRMLGDGSVPVAPAQVAPNDALMVVITIENQTRLDQLEAN